MKYLLLVLPLSLLGCPVGTASDPTTRGAMDSAEGKVVKRVEKSYNKVTVTFEDGDKLVIRLRENNSVIRLVEKRTNNANHST